MIKGERSIHSVWPWYRIFFVGLSLFALIMSLTLSWYFLTGESMAGCGGGSFCERVLSSKWSKIGGILPVSSLAVGVYLAMFFAGFFIGSDTEMAIRNLAWKVILVLTGSVAGGAIWFIVLQKWVIGEFCFYCMTTHITGLIIASMVYWRTVKKEGQNPVVSIGEKLESADLSVQKNLYEVTRSHARGYVLAGWMVATLMAVVQVGMMPKAVGLNGESQQKITAIDHSNVPIIGLADAPIVVNLLFDYQCAHCQKIHFMLNEVISRYRGQLAIVPCPTPLASHCNQYISRDVDAFKNSCELAKIGLAVWKAKREAFSVFENWMFAFESGDRWYPRKLEAVRAKAVELVGKTEFDKALASPWIDGYLHRCVEMFGLTLQNGKGGIPKLIYGSKWVIPEPENGDDLIRIMQQSLDLPKPMHSQ